MRALARRSSCEPSTILRRVRRVENRRDDPLVDLALDRLGRLPLRQMRRQHRPDMERPTMDTLVDLPDAKMIDEEARRVLRRMAEQGACLALAPAMDTAVVVRETGDGGPALRTAVVSREIAEALALKEWIERYGEGRILRYRITALGRTALKRLIAESENGRVREETGLDRTDPFGTPDAEGKPYRYSMPESPLVALARRKDRSGQAFLTDDLLAAGERLREDFELSGTGEGAEVDWDGIILGGDIAPEPQSGAADARMRVARALRALGPGLGDIVLRCCCRLEGLEAAERDMGWAARSGKIVLRIALQRLKIFYDENSEAWSPLIG
ncbi:MAG: DUF6456 domain-containing protein [Pseudomonadota bacterium]